MGNSVAYQSVSTQSIIQTNLNGDIYEGHFDPQTYTGHGQIKYHSGIIYEGDFVDGVPHGQGTTQFTNGRMMTSTFEKGLPHGKGTIIDPRGGQFQGTWRYNQLHGQATYTTPRQQIYEFVYENGKQVWSRQILANEKEISELLTEFNEFYILS